MSFAQLISEHENWDEERKKEKKAQKQETKHVDKVIMLMIIRECIWWGEKHWLCHIAMMQVSSKEEGEMEIMKMEREVKKWWNLWMRIDGSVLIQKQDEKY